MIIDILWRLYVNAVHFSKHVVFLFLETCDSGALIVSIKIVD